MVLQLGLCVKDIGISCVAEHVIDVVQSTQSNTEERQYYIYLLRTHPPSQERFRQQGAHSGPDSNTTV